MPRRSQRSLGEDAVEFVGTPPEVLHGLLVRFAVAERQGYDRLLFRDDPLLGGLGRPGKGDAGRHHVEPHLFGNVNDREHLKGVRNRKHCAHGKDRLMIIGNLPVEVSGAPPGSARARTLCECTPPDSPRRRRSEAASSSANLSPEMPLMPGSVVRWRFRIGSIFSSFSTAMLIGVPMSWYLLIMSVSVSFCVYFLEDLLVLFVDPASSKERHRRYHDGLEVLASHDRAPAEPAEMPVGVDVDVCHGRPVLACRPDAQDAAVPGALGYPAQHLSGLEDILAPEIGDVFNLEMA